MRWWCYIVSMRGRGDNRFFIVVIFQSSVLAAITTCRFKSIVVVFFPS